MLLRHDPHVRRRRRARRRARVAPALQGRRSTARSRRSRTAPTAARSSTARATSSRRPASRPSGRRSRARRSSTASSTASVTASASRCTRSPGMGLAVEAPAHSRGRRHGRARLLPAGLRRRTARGPRARDRRRGREPDAVPLRPRTVTTAKRHRQRCSSRSGATRRRPSSRRRRTLSPGSTTRTSTTFWAREGRERVAWFEPFTKLYEWEPPYAKWYLGGKLNVAWNCLDKHVESGARRLGRLLLGRRARRATAGS